MPTLPWRSFAEVDAGREYHVLASRLPLKSYWAVPRFLRLTLAVQGQLKQSPGLIGYSLAAQLPSKTFLTLSVWQDAAALKEFARAQPHQDVMSRLRTSMGATTLVTWQATGSAVPPSWDEAKQRLDQG